MNENNYPKEIILRDGTGVTLRPSASGDEQPLYHMYSRFSDEDKWFEEKDVSDFSLMEDWINQSDHSRLRSIVAILEEKIIGHGILSKRWHGARSHMGKINVSVHPSFRAKHLGTWLLLDLINAAVDMGIDFVVMSLIEDKDASMIMGMERLNFKKDAILKDYLRDMQGAPHNLILMGKHILID